MPRRHFISAPVAYVASVLTGLWAAYTVYLVGTALRALAVSDVIRFRILGAEGADGMISVPGLVYEGTAGIALATIEILVIALAVFCSWSTNNIYRRTSVLILLAWAALWLGGSLWMESLANWNHPNSTIAAATGCAAATLCAISRWRSA